MARKNIDLPSSLKEFLKKDEFNHRGFYLKTAHFVELDHPGTEFFPAVEIQTENMVLTTELGLLRMVCSVLPPRKHRLITQLVYVNLDISVAYPIVGIKETDLAKSGPIKILTWRRFEALMDGVHPVFGWKPGIEGVEIHRQDFLEAVENAKTWFQDSG